MKPFFKLGFLFLSFVFFCNNLYSQEIDLFRSSDLSKVNIDLYTDDEITKYREQLKLAGITEVQAEQLAIQKGIPRAELLKLKSRFERLDNYARKNSSQQTSTSGRRNDVDSPKTRLSTPRDPMEFYVFGSDLFNENFTTFEPNLRIATPKNYTLGPDDELLIDLYGYQEFNYELTVSPEGTITMPYVGVIAVSGLTIEQATKKIRDRMIRNGYSTLASGRSTLEVNVGRIKSIRITLVGEAKNPGTYTLSAFASTYTALNAGGGITNKGSYRQIELIRNNKVIDKLDIYDFLMRADLSNNSGLMDGDVIRIPVADVQVEVRGEVKREGIFEMLPNETVNDLIRFTGGFTNEAYTASIHIQQLTDRERRLEDVSKAEFGTYTFRKGDVVFVDKILNTYANRVTIKGAVQRPGQYELTPGLTLSQLIKRADGLREDALRERGILVRRSENLSPDVLPFQVSEILSGIDDIILKKEDSITIASIFDYRENYIVTLQGEVRRPGDYKYVNNLSLKDLLFQAGGLTDAAAPQQIEIARRLNTDTANVLDQRIAEVIDISSARDLLLKGGDIKLEPWDIIIVRTKLGYKRQVSVRVEGEVLYPGTYILETKEDRVSDLIKRAGGTTPQAYIDGAFLTRKNIVDTATTNIQRIRKIQNEVDDSTNAILEDVTKATVTVGIELDKILEKPKSIDDIILVEGDVLTVGKAIFEIKVNGEVMFPTQVVYRKGEDLRYYVDKAGGFSDKARKKRTYVLYANGSAGKTKKFLFFKNYPPVEAGSTILVPAVPNKKNSLSSTEIIALTTGVASLVGVFVALLNFLKQ